MERKPRLIDADKLLEWIEGNRIVKHVLFMKIVNGEFDPDTSKQEE